MSTHEGDFWYIRATTGPVDSPKLLYNIEIETKEEIAHFFRRVLSRERPFVIDTFRLEIAHKFRTLTRDYSSYTVDRTRGRDLWISARPQQDILDAWEEAGGRVRGK